MPGYTEEVYCLHAPFVRPRSSMAGCGAKSPLCVAGPRMRTGSDELCASCFPKHGRRADPGESGEDSVVRTAAEARAEGHRSPRPKNHLIVCIRAQIARAQTRGPRAGLRPSADIPTLSRSSVNGFLTASSEKTVCGVATPGFSAEKPGVSHKHEGMWPFRRHL